VARAERGLPAESYTYRRPIRHDVLVLDHVEPDALLAPDLDLGAHQGEAALLVQADRTGVLAHDARDQGVKARFLASVLMSCRAAPRRRRDRARAVRRRPSSRRSWRRPDGRERARPAAKPRIFSPRAPSLSDLVVLVDRHDAGMGARGVVRSRPLARPEVRETRSKLTDLSYDLGVVDVHERRGVVDFDQARSHESQG
jgi:hypothetical protein